MSTCYANPNPPFQPAMRIIAAITNSNPATVTTTFSHQYLDGTIVRLDIPVACGMQQLSGLIPGSSTKSVNTYPIFVTSPTTFTIPVDTTNFDPFAIPAMPGPHVNTCAMVVPVGEISATLKAATINILNPQQVMGG